MGAAQQIGHLQAVWGCGSLFVGGHHLFVCQNSLYVQCTMLLTFSKIHEFARYFVRWVVENCERHCISAGTDWGVGDRCSQCKDFWAAGRLQSRSGIILRRVWDLKRTTIVKEIMQSCKAHWFVPWIVECQHTEKMERTMLALMQGHRSYRRWNMSHFGACSAPLSFWYPSCPPNNDDICWHVVMFDALMQLIDVCVAWRSVYNAL